MLESIDPPPEPLCPAHELLRSARKVVPIIGTARRKTHFPHILEILPWGKERRMRLENPAGKKERLILPGRLQGLDAVVYRPEIDRRPFIGRPDTPVRVAGPVFGRLIEFLRRHVLRRHHLEIIKRIVIVKPLPLVVEDLACAPNRIPCRPELLHDGSTFRHGPAPVAVVGVDPGR